jgi:hypothetical protein
VSAPTQDHRGSIAGRAFPRHPFWPPDRGLASVGAHGDRTDREPRSFAPEDDAVGAPDFFGRADAGDRRVAGQERPADRRSGPAELDGRDICRRDDLGALDGAAGFARRDEIPRAFARTAARLRGCARRRARMREMREAGHLDVPVDASGEAVRTIGAGEVDRWRALAGGRLPIGELSREAPALAAGERDDRDDGDDGAAHARSVRLLDPKRTSA